MKKEKHQAKCPFAGIDVDDCPYVGYEGNSCLTDMYTVCPFAKIIGLLERIAKSLEDIAEK